MFRDGQSDAGDVGFLKRVGTNQLAANLTSDADDRRGIQHGGGDSSDHVGRARARGSDGHAHFTARASVAVCHVSCALFMAHQHVVNFAVLQSVIGGQDRAARVSEHVAHALPFEALPEYLRSGLRHLANSLFCFITANLGRWLDHKVS